MTICLLASSTDIVCWGIYCVGIFILMPLIIRTIDEIHIVGKETSVVVATGLLEFCFLGVVYIVAHNKSFQCVTDNNTCFLLMVFTIYTSCAVCLCVATILGLLVKILRTQRENIYGI
jgi:hypothetical protein